MKIGDREFKIEKFTNFKALRLHRKIVSKLAPSIGNVLGAFKDLDSEIDSAKIVNSLQNLFDNLPEDEYLGLLKELFSVVNINIKQKSQIKNVQFTEDNFETLIDSVFDDPFDIYKVLWEILKVNFSPLFSKVQNIINRITIFTSQEEEVNETK